MARRTLDLEALARDARGENSLPLAMLMQSIEDAAVSSCVGCGIFAGAVTGFTLTPEQCGRLGIAHGDGPDGPLMVMPLCPTCDARCDVNAEFLATIEERVVRLAEGGKVGMHGVEKT